VTNKQLALLGELALAWSEQPHLRLGQLIENVVRQQDLTVGLFYVEDTELRIALMNSRSEHAKRMSAD
jgi:hypothetical protein